MARNASTDALPLSGCNSWYDSTTKAVRTAEKRPAWIRYKLCPVAPGIPRLTNTNNALISSSQFLNISSSVSLQ
jgi:hypothetical protein